MPKNFSTRGRWLSYVAFALAILCGQISLADVFSPLQLRLETVDNSPGGPALDGFVTNDLLIDTEDRLYSFELYLVLEQGTIYQDPLGTSTPPPEGIVRDFFPSLGYDTFVALGNQYFDSPYGTSLIVGKAVDLHAVKRGEDPRTPTMNESGINITWATMPGTEVRNVDSFLTSRITLSDDSKGYWRFLAGASFPWGDNDSISYTSYAGFPEFLFPGENTGKIENGVLAFPKNVHFVANSLIPPPLFYEKLKPPQTPLTISQVNNELGGQGLDNFVTNDLRTDFDSTARIYKFQLLLNLDNGVIYQDENGSMHAPLKTTLDASEPALAFDTFVALGDETANGVNGIPSHFSSASDIGGLDSTAFDEQTLDISWRRNYLSDIVGYEDFLISRITLSDDATGEWQLLISTWDEHGIVHGTITNGHLEIIQFEPEEEEDEIIDPLANPFLRDIPKELLNSPQPFDDNQPGSVFMYNFFNASGQTTVIDDRFDRLNRIEQNNESRIPEPTTFGMCLAATMLLASNRRRSANAAS